MKSNFPIFLCVFLRWVLVTSSSISRPTRPVKVVVTGAGNSVGFHVFKKLLAKKSILPIGLVRDRPSFDRLVKLGADPSQIKIGDITDKASLKGVFDGVNKAVLCTTARPKSMLGYRFKNFFRKLVGRDRPPTTSELYYKKNETPYDVDFVGQKNVIDACLKANVEHVVLLGNMGGYKGSKINEIGKSQGVKDPKAGNILKWKRAAERYLMKRCFFTVVHAAALTDDKGGMREIVWDTDDALLRTNFRKIPREDVAEVLVQALMWKEAIGRSIDVAARTEGSGPNDDWLRFWAYPGNCVYPADYDDQVT